VIVMAAVAVYPIGYAIYLSLQHYDLRFPQLTHIAGLSNYGAVLSSGIWWHALAVTVVITVASVAAEFMLGMAFALLLNYTPLWRGLVRTSILIPYGIVTVAAAYSWQFAWTPGVGYLADLLPVGAAPLTSQWQAIGIIILAEIWKTTPFMTLLLLAGLTLVPGELLRAAKVDGAAGGSGSPGSCCR
jgi:multiple sugar transport system permease protein